MTRAVRVLTAYTTGTKAGTATNTWKSVGRRAAPQVLMRVRDGVPERKRSVPPISVSRSESTDARYVYVPDAINDLDPEAARLAEPPRELVPLRVAVEHE